MEHPKRSFGSVLFVMSLMSIFLLCAISMSKAQITPSGDAYTNSAAPTVNYGASTLLDVDGASQITYIQFNLSSIPAGASVSQATLKLYVNAVTKTGSFNVDYVNGAWSESTITYSLSPALGNTIVSGVPITTAQKNQYVLINITPAVVAWLNGSETNDGVALVANNAFNANFDSKENTGTSHPPELDIVFSGDGTITGVTTGSGSGLIGGGTSGKLNLSLTNACSKNQILQWNGTLWACASAGTGTITGVIAGKDLTESQTGGSVTLNLDTTKVAQLSANNTFTGFQSISGGLNVAGSVTISNGGNGVLTADAIDLGIGGAPQFFVVGPNASAAIYPSFNSFIDIHDFRGDNGVGSEPGQAAIQGNEMGITSGTFGVAGFGTNPGVGGVLGQTGGASQTSLSFSGFSPGIWADTGHTGGLANGVMSLLTTADDNTALYAASNSPSGYPTIYAINASNGTAIEGAGSGSAAGVTGLASSNGSGVMGFSTGSGPGNGVVGYGASGGSGVVGVAATGGTGYGVYSFGNLGATGTKTAVVALPDDRLVSLYAMESPENWFEDFGSGQLTNGVATIELDPTFVGTVSAASGYHVFLTPNGDCEGLYVTQRTSTSFEVRELRRGRSSVAFDYRIIAKRKGVENLRLEEVGADHDTAEAIRKQMSDRASHTPKLVVPKAPEHVKAPDPQTLTRKSGTSAMPKKLTMKPTLVNK